MYAPPNEKKLAFEARQAKEAAKQREQIETCYRQYLTPQERAARDQRRLERGLPIRRRGRR